MQYTKNFTELGKDDAPIAGGKGASLGEMTTAGIPVPGGYVVLADTFDAFLKETDLVQEIDAILDGVNHEAIHTVETASESIQALILSRPMPEAMQNEIQEKFASLGSQYVAVRSSATAEDGAEHAWAGQLDSFLNTTEHDLIEKVRKCWASLFTPRAIFYRFEKGLHTTHISVAVVVQKMVNSEKSGIAFSVHPVTEDYNQLIIEAGFGLGEAIVSGSVTPDSYVVEKSPRNILDINVSHQVRALYRIEGGGSEWSDLSETVGNSQVLTEVQINELSDIILRIENHYGFPCDIEWAAASEGPERVEGQKLKFYIVQSRPITTLSKKDNGAMNPKSQEGYLSSVKETDWQADWEGDFPTFSLALGMPAYFARMQEIFGTSIQCFLTIHKGRVTTGYLPTKEYEGFGQKLAQLAADEKYLSLWIENFKKSADHIKSLMNKGPEVAFQNLQELQTAYNEYGAYQIATKAAYNFLPLESDDIREKLEEGRKYSETFYYDSTVFVESVAKLIAEETGYDTQAIMALTLGELSQYLSSGILPLELVLSERWKKSGVLWGDNKEIVLSGDEITNLESFWESNIDTDNLKGEVAYPGKVQGVCRVIKNFKDATLKEGEILVTGMTDPNFVPLMKIAKAIVTDSGGLLCHAAIIARELKIPCIIGTKAATKVLKDGDLVEVDAETGVVRILEKAEDSCENNNQKVPIPLTKDNTVFTFESTGTTFIFEDIVSRCYIQWESIRVAKGDNVRVFVEKDEVKRLNAEGRVMTKEFLEEKVRCMQECSEYIKTNVVLVQKDAMTREELDMFFQPMEEICRNYSFFDIHYSDGMVDGDGFTEAGEYIERVKNILRDTLGEPFFEPQGWLMLGLQLLAKQFSLSRETLEWYTRADIENLFAGVIVDEKIISERLLASVLYRDREGQKVVTLTGDAALACFSSFEDTVTDVSEIRGAVAHRGQGTTQGKVRIVKKDFSDPSYLVRVSESIQEGEILVTDTTDPDFLPIMSKVIAIVTDVGGMLSHASITSRELNKLCVVGTVVASRVIKDGDLVEVDAENGVVRILEREEKLEIGNYQKLFQWPGEFSYFLSSYFMAIYNKYKAISLQDGNMWQSFLLNASKDETLKSGLALYSSEQKYNELSKGLTEGFVALADNFDQVLKKDVLTKEDVGSLFEQALEHYSYYSQTEFFFTDLAYAEMNNISQIQKNFETFDELKLRGREYLNKIALAPGCYLDQLLEKIADQLGCATDSLKYHSINEILELFDGKVMTSDELVDRNQYFMHGKGTHTEILTGSTALGKIRDFFEEVTRTGELKGQTANKGYYKGVARVFRFSLSEINLMDEEIERMKKGEVLIADTTAPEIILACKKAGAIVTNQGGMMSHAAIVARELNIPCVVGTGHITEIVKTGDLIEVDANSGVVKIL